MSCSTSSRSRSCLDSAGLIAFLWTLKSGQYDDLDGAAIRILPDDDIGRTNEGA